MTIEVRIGSMLLEGVSPAERDRVVAGFERELARLLAEPVATGMFTRPASRPTLHANPIISPVGNVRGLGERIARAVFGALGSTSRASAARPGAAADRAASTATHLADRRAP